MAVSADEGLLHDIRHVMPLPGYALLIEFDDGYRVASVSGLVERGGVFKQLEDRQLFERVFVDSEGGTVTWPGELDLCPDALYEESVAVPDSLIQGLRGLISNSG